MHTHRHAHVWRVEVNVEHLPLSLHIILEVMTHIESAYWLSKTSWPKHSKILSPLPSQPWDYRPCHCTQLFHGFSCLNLGPHARTAGVLPTELSPGPTLFSDSLSLSAKWRWWQYIIHRIAEKLGNVESTLGIATGVKCWTHILLILWTFLRLSMHI